jgi:hypothetical protein
MLWRVDRDRALSQRCCGCYLLIRSTRTASPHLPDAGSTVDVAFVSGLQPATSCCFAVPGHVTQEFAQPI